MAARSAIRLWQSAQSDLEDGMTHKGRRVSNTDSSYDSHQIKGWRTRMEETAGELRRNVWLAPSTTTYLPGKEPAPYDDWVGHESWHRRVYGPERQAAVAALAAHQKEVKRLRNDEVTPEQRDAKRRKLTPEQLRANRARYAAETPEQRERRNRKLREWRARQSPEWRQRQAEMKARRRAARLDLYREIDRASQIRCRDAINARKRAAYAANPELFRRELNERRARKRVELAAVSGTARATTS
jgi:hypothetical protein